MAGSAVLGGSVVKHVSTTTSYAHRINTQTTAIANDNDLSIFLTLASFSENLYALHKTLIIPTQQRHPLPASATSLTMSYMGAFSFSNVLTSTTSRFASIKDKVMPNENDGDTEDDTNICRALRTYYTEKRQAYPAWLPPDPRAPQQVPVQPVYAPVGSGYGKGPAESGQLSSLWGSQPPSQSQPQPQSLRRPPMGAQQRSNASVNPSAEVRPRGLPSQNGNSYQNAYQSSSTNPNSEKPLSASAALKAKMRQRTASPANAAPAMDQGRQASYNSTSSASYEAPRSSQSRSGGSSKPIVSANAPWDTGDSEFTPSGYRADDYNSGRSGGARQGLPAGPARGLPGGPRAYR